VQTLVTGATGFIGKQLVALLREQGHTVTTLSRDTGRAQSQFGPEVVCLAWNDKPVWQRAVSSVDAVFHLAGASVAGQRWTTEYKREIRDSRLTTTRAIAEAGPRVLISASAVGYYGGRGDTILAEDASPGEDFLADVCVHWEQAAHRAETTGGRVACVRIGQVVGKGGGTLNAMLHPPVVPFSPFQLGVGGPLGDGKQWMSWIHLQDVVRLFLWCSEQASASGPYNAVAPHPVTHQEFARVLGRVLQRPAVVPVPAFALRALLGEFADYVLYSQRVVPKRALDAGFRFEHNSIEAAIRAAL
jgi:hypothetical protein